MACTASGPSAAQQKTGTCSSASVPADQGSARPRHAMKRSCSARMPATAQHSQGSAPSIMPHTSCSVVVPSAFSLHPACQAAKVGSVPAGRRAGKQTEQRSVSTTRSSTPRRAVRAPAAARLQHRRAKPPRTPAAGGCCAAPAMPPYSAVMRWVRVWKRRKVSRWPAGRVGQRSRHASCDRSTSRPAGRWAAAGRHQAGMHALRATHLRSGAQ
jgi:hypothetical protein